MLNKEDYKVSISFSKDGEAFWAVTRKDIPIICNKEELEFVNKTLKHLYEKTKKGLEVYE